MRCQFLVFLVIMIGVAGCGQKQASQDPASQQAVAQVNNYTITVNDFNHEVGFLKPVFNSVSSIPPHELKLSILDEMINRELLLEEAQRMNIDKDPEFMRQIENFWRLSLIKQVLKHKIVQIEKSITVSDEEIKAEYARQKSPAEAPQSLQEMAPQIQKIIFQAKVKEALQAWEDSLKTGAVIQRNYGVLNTIPISDSQGGADGQGK
jgi:hypothetical protein